MPVRKTLKKKRGGAANQNDEANEATKVYEDYKNCKDENKSKGRFSKTPCKKNVIRSFNKLIGNAVVNPNDNEENNNTAMNYQPEQVKRSIALDSEYGNKTNLYRVVKKIKVHPRTNVRKVFPKTSSKGENNSPRARGYSGPPSGGSRKKRTLKKKARRPKKQSTKRKARK